MTNQNNQSANILQTVIKEFGLDELPQEAQERLLAKMTEVLLKRIILKTLEGLSSQERDELDKLQSKESAKPEDIDNFLQQKIPDYQQLVKEEVDNFKKEMQESIANLKTAYA